MKKSAQDILKQVNEFYQTHPFPGFDVRKYSHGDDLRSQASWFGKLIDDQIPYFARIADLGCGTGQMAAFLALKDRQVLGGDYSQRSLEKARSLKDRLKLDNLSFERVNVLDLNLPENHFDYVLCLGVLHHTSDPCLGFQNLVRITRENGYIILGLYNSFGRLAVKMRRQMRSMFARSSIEERAVQRQLAGQGEDLEKTESWLADQYYHPHESTHSVGEVLGWFEQNGIVYVNSLPPIEWFRAMEKNRRIFKQPQVASWRRSALARLCVQLKWIWSLKDNGGYFILVGQKR